MGDYGYGREDRYGGAMRGGDRGYDRGNGRSGGMGAYAAPYGGSFGGMEQSPLDAEIQVVIREIHNEQAIFDQSGEWGTQFKNAKRLLAAEAEKLENIIDPEWLEVDIPKPIKVTKKVLIPNFRNPRFNYVGKLMGAKGANLQELVKTHNCKISVRGRGSTKDRARERDLLASGDPQYAHFGCPLHVQVEAVGPPDVAYQRIAGVLEALSKTLVPTREGPDEDRGDRKVKKEDEDEDNRDGSGDRRSSGGFRGGRGGSRGRGGGDRGRGRDGYNPY